MRHLDERLRQDLVEKNIWRDTCPVSLEKLVVLNVRYINFDGDTREDGEIMVLDEVAENVQNIFHALYEIKFPIHQMKLINHYNGDDDASMEDNNSSAFNCRKIAGTDRFSKHSYGIAIDINPRQNPFIITGTDPHKIFPQEGKDFLDRTNVRKGMITQEVINIFSDNGFTIWGGHWTSPIDYHHFEVPLQMTSIK